MSVVFVNANLVNMCLVICSTALALGQRSRGPTRPNKRRPHNNKFILFDAAQSEDEPTSQGESGDSDANASDISNLVEGM